MPRKYFLIFLTLAACSSTPNIETDSVSDNRTAEEMVMDQLRADAAKRQAVKDKIMEERQRRLDEQKKATEVAIPPTVTVSPTPEPALQSEKPGSLAKARFMLKADVILEKFPGSYYVEPPVINSNNQKMIVYLHGAEGPSERSMEFAYELATAGYHVLHYCWYHCGKYALDDFEPLNSININTVAGNIKFLTSIKRLKFNSYILVGSDRGAELVGLMLSRQNEVGINIEAGVMISASAVVLPPRGKLKRKEINEIYKSEKWPEKFVLNGNVWNTDLKEFVTGTPIEVNKFRGPLLIMHGSEDKLVPVENARALKKKYEEGGRQAQVLIFDDEKHLLSRAGVDLAVSKIIRFLSGG